MSSTGQCDCCGANDVELSFSVAYGIETWSCAEGCDIRTMVCPFCGHTCTTGSIGAVYCGPHGTGAATTPAVRMVERAAHANADPTTTTED